MAGHNPHPWFWKRKKAWYVNLDGKRISLGKDKAEALRNFHNLMAKRDSKQDEPEFQSLTVGELAEQYLSDLGRRAGSRTVYVARCYLKPFLRDCGSRAARALKKHHVEAVIRNHGAWNGTTENHVKSRIVALFNWGLEQGLIGTNPIKGIRKPRAQSRGCQAVIDVDEQEKLMAEAPTYLRNVLFALQQTGARPCEVLKVAAKDFDAEAGLWVLQDHKTAHATGKPRIIYLTPALNELCKSLACTF